MSVESSRPVVSTPTLAQATGFPVRSVPSSASAHVVVVVVILLLGFAPVIRDASPYTRVLTQRVELQRDNPETPLLPQLDSSSASASSPASASARSTSGRDAASSASSMPLIHQRRQHIISNTPDATNTVQTILQPGLEHPRLLATLPVPSMIRMAPPRQALMLTAPVMSKVVTPAAPPAPAPVPQPTLPKIQPSTIDAVPLTSATELADSPKLPAFATSGRSFQAAPKPAPPPPPPPAATKPSAPTVAVNTAPTPPPSTAAPSTGTDSRNLLVVNAFEVKSTLSERDIPPGEIHGRFEVALSPSLPEAPTTGGSSSSVGVANSGVASSGNGAGKGHSTSVSGASAGTAHGNGSGGGTSKIAGSGSGRDTGLGNGTGAGTGHAASAGTGNGTGTSPAGGSGGSPFSGMTITGGTSSSLDSSAASGNVDVHNPPGTYGMTITSSGSSGGGLRDYGVFHDGPVYTVYVNVARIGIQGARWSLQYSASRDVRIAHAGYPLTPPFPHTEVLPLLPPSLVAANVGRLFVFQAMLKADGTLEGFHVVETPDARLIDPILSTLTKWTFEPASMGDDKVPIKILMGIPIASVMADTGVSQQAGAHAPADTALHSNAQ